MIPIGPNPIFYDAQIFFQCILLFWHCVRRLLSKNLSELNIFNIYVIYLRASMCCLG